VINLGIKTYRGPPISRFGRFSLLRMSTARTWTISGQRWPKILPRGHSLSVLSCKFVEMTPSGNGPIVCLVAAPCGGIVLSSLPILTAVTVSQSRKGTKARTFSL